MGDSKGLERSSRKSQPRTPRKKRKGCSTRPRRGIDRCYIVLRSVARKILKDPEDLEDVVQEFFLDVCPNEEEKKPYGRVFYIKGKSLIFYGFRFKGD